MIRVDFNETFAPMAKFIIMRCIVVTRMAMDWEIYQINIKTTFFKNKVLKVEIYIDQPEWFIQTQKNFVRAQVIAEGVLSSN